MSERWSFETRQVRVGQNPDATGARALPVHARTSSVVEDPARAADLIALERSDNASTRLTNPTTDVLADLGDGSRAASAPDEERRPATSPAPA